MKKLFTLTTIVIMMTSCGKYATTGELAQVKRDLDETNKTVDDINTRLNRYMILVDANTNAISETGYDLSQLESNISDMNDKLELLEDSQPRIIDVYKPCPNAKEVLLELDTGEMLGYFEKGNKRYLSILESGRYRTTDGTNCHFTID